MYTIDNQWISLEELDRLTASGEEVTLSDTVKNQIKACRSYLDDKVKRADKLIYGVNTGFGSLCNTAISSEDLEQLQRNLVILVHFFIRSIYINVQGVSFKCPDKKL